MPASLKAKTADLRRQHILDAAIRIFDARGFGGATIREIANEAGVSDGTIYNVFESKEALLLAILEPLLAASGPANPPGENNSGAAELLQGMITARWNALTPQTLAMMRVVWSEALTNRKLAGLYLEKVAAPAFETPAPLFQKLSDQGAIAAADIPVTLRVIVASFLGLALLKMLGDPLVNDRSGEAGAQLAGLLTKGLLPRHAMGDGHDAV